jgi:2-hydroxychromene-2-carboxylate isomerase
MTCKWAKCKMFMKLGIQQRQLKKLEDDKEIMTEIKMSDEIATSLA